MGPDAAGLNQIEDIVANIISLVVGIGFITALILLIWAGLKYLTSGGEPKAVQSAHSVTTWALLGIVFMAIAWLILQLVAGFTGLEKITVFDIKILCGDKNDPLKFCTK